MEKIEDRVKGSGGELKPVAEQKFGSDVGGDGGSLGRMRLTGSQR